jgi:hypothetical protein
MDRGAASEFYSGAKRFGEFSSEVFCEFCFEAKRF